MANTLIWCAGLYRGYIRSSRNANISRFPLSRNAKNISFAICFPYGKNPYSRRLSGMITAMSDITDAGPRLRAINDALAEIERLRLTDAERRAIADAADRYAEITPESAETAATLRGLLERTGGGA